VSCHVRSCRRFISFFCVTVSCHCFVVLSIGQQVISSRPLVLSFHVILLCCFMSFCVFVLCCHFVLSFRVVVFVLFCCPFLSFHVLILCHPFVLFHVVISCHHLVSSCCVFKDAPKRELKSLHIVLINKHCIEIFHMTQGMHIQSPQAQGLVSNVNLYYMMMYTFY
jgi:hypothetical protein